MTTAGAFIIFLSAVMPVAAASSSATLVPASTPASVPETLVVTAARMPVALEELGDSVTVVTAADIALHQYRSIADVLNAAPGLHVSPSGGIGAQTSVFVRGTESDHVLVMIDGVEVASPASGSYEFAHLRLDHVERIEIVRGARSAQYGSEAIGGVVHVITRRGGAAGEEASARARVETGSFDTRTVSAGLSGAHGAFDFSLSADHTRTDGESFTPRRLRGGHGGERDAYRRYGGKLSFGLALHDDARLSLSSGYSDIDADYDQNTFDQQTFEKSGVGGTTRRRWSSLALEHGYFGGAWRSRWSVSSAADKRRDHDNGMEVGEFSGRRFKLDWHNVLVADENLDLVFGAETELEKARTRDGLDAAARTRAAYLEARLSLSEQWFLTYGLRNDDPDDFGSKRSCHLSAAWRPHPGTRLHANYGTGFKAPSLTDRFQDFPAFNFVANPDLKPETSRSWEIGFDRAFGDWRVGGVYFHSRLRDLIDFTGNTLVNRQSASVEGLETFLAWRPHAAFDARLDYTLTSAAARDRTRLLRRPLRKAILDLGRRFPSGASLNLQLIYTGPRTDVDRVTFGRVRKGGYATARLAARYPLTRDAELFARIDNLLDRRYEPVDGYRGNSIGFHAGLSFRM